jgi:hypothetical protein
MSPSIADWQKDWDAAEAEIDRLTLKVVALEAEVGRWKRRATIAEAALAARGGDA